MKKLAIAVLTACVLMLTACGNYKFIDTTYTFNYAYIQLQNGEVVEGEVESWTDYDGEQLQVKIDGVTYLTSSFNCTLVVYPKDQIPQNNTEEGVK